MATGSLLLRARLAGGGLMLTRRRASLRLQDRPIRLLLESALLLVNLVGWGAVVWLWGSILWGPRP
jgi:hypothetical protein